MLRMLTIAAIALAGVSATTPAFADDEYNVSVGIQGNRASKSADEFAEEVVAPSCLFELGAV